MVVHAPQPGTVMYPHPNAVHVQNYPIQTPDEGFANPGYQVNGPAIHSGVMPKQGMVWFDYWINPNMKVQHWD